MTTDTIISKVWSFYNILRDDDEKYSQSNYKREDRVHFRFQ